MGTLHQIVMPLAVSWVAVTATLVAMLIYRGILDTHEEDQIFLDPAERSLALEHQTLVARIEKLARPIRLMALLSGTLFVVTFGVWLWTGLANI